MQTTLSQLCGPMGTLRTLPPVPGTSAVRRQVDVRRRAIEAEALPALALRRELLMRIWRVDGGEAVPLFTTAGEAILSHPLGAHRLADVLAEQEGLIHELSALRELAAALDLYEEGGSSVLSFIGESAISGTTEMTTCEVPHIPSPRDGRAYTRWLLEYLLEVQRDIWAARNRHDTQRVDDLRAELKELQVRVQRHANGARTEALDAAETRQVSRSA